MSKCMAGMTDSSVSVSRYICQGTNLHKSQIGSRTRNLKGPEPRTTAN